MGAPEIVRAAKKKKNKKAYLRLPNKTIFVSENGMISFMPFFTFYYHRARSRSLAQEHRSMAIGVADPFSWVLKLTMPIS